MQKSVSNPSEASRTPVLKALKPLVITAGEPAGIGPDALIILAQQSWDFPWVALGHAESILQRAKKLGLTVTLSDYDAKSDHVPAGTLPLISFDTAEPVVTGQLNPKNAKHVLNLLDFAIEGCLASDFSAMVTAPISKSVINDFGLRFSGHTEYLAEKTQAEDVVMMLTTYSEKPLRVCLASTHLPLKNVSDALTAERVARRASIIDHDLRIRFGLEQPFIAMAGVNPHAGENGYLGREEIDTLNPVITQLQAAGLNLQGPYPADTMFTTIEADAYYCMFHDQGLPVVKYAGFGQVVNVSLGLPIIRTSVDHGCALDLAGTGKIKISSLQAAMQLARDMAYQEQASKQCMRS